MTKRLWQVVMRATWTLVFALAGLAASASAQEATRLADLPLRLNLGDEVGIEDRSGAVTWGRVERLTAEEIVIAAQRGGERVFPGASVRRVERRGDSLLNGMGRGAVIGGAFGCGVFGVFSGEFRGGDCLAAFLIFGGAGLGLGLAFDALHTGTTPVFSAPDHGARWRRPFAGGVAARATWRW